LDVYYCYNPTPQQQGNAGFGVDFEWDIPLLEGYSSTFLTQKLTIRKVIAAGSYDAVVINGWSYHQAICAIFACWASGTPVMIRSDSHLNTPRHHVKRLMKYLPYRAFISRMDACLSVGQWSTDYYLHYGAKPERVFQVPHVIDQNRFDREIEKYSPAREELRRAWRLGKNTIVFLFVGKFISKKRPKDFIRAVHLAACRDSRIQGLMVGDGPLREECESLTQRLAAPIHFAGFLNQSEIISAYVASDALILPSDGGETWGLVVNEAMYCRLPCLVSSKVGCGPDLVSPDTGGIFPLGDVEHLASHVAGLAEDTRELTAMGCRARQLIQQRYSPANAVEGLLEAVDALSRIGPSHAGLPTR